jgi:hypothetical protein
MVVDRFKFRNRIGVMSPSRRFGTTVGCGRALLTNRGVKRTGCE